MIKELCPKSFPDDLFIPHPSSFVFPPRQAPESAHREDNREERDHTECEVLPRPEEGPAGVGCDPAPNKSVPHHVQYGNARSNDRSEKDDDVPGATARQHERSVHPNDQNKNRYEHVEPSPLHPAGNFIRQVKRQEEDREQRCDG